MDALLSFLFGRREYSVVDAGNGAIFVLRTADVRPVTGRVIRQGLRHRAAEKLARREREKWRETPRSIHDRS